MKVLLGVVLASAAQAQTGSFIATLGRDTMHLERFARSGNTIEGTIVTRVPQTRVTKYRMTLGDNGRLSRYDVAISNADGSSLALNGSSGAFVYGADSIQRTTIDKGQTVQDRVPVTRAVFPGPSIPYVGVSYLSYE